MKGAPFPFTEDELIEYANDKGLSNSVIEKLHELEKEDEPEREYENLKDICPDYADEYDDNY